MPIIPKIIVDFLSSAFKKKPETKEVTLGKSLLVKINKPAEDYDKVGVLALIEEGADLTAEDGDGNNAALFAAWHGHTEVYKALITKGSDPDHQNHLQQTAAMIAAEKGHEGIIDFLVNDCVFEGARPDLLKKNYFGDSALSISIREGRNLIVNILESAQRVQEKDRTAARDRALATAYPPHFY